MKHLYFIVCLFLTLSLEVMGQSLSTSGNVTTTNSVTFTSVTAGDIPIGHILDGPPTLIFSSTSQSLRYSWPFYGNPDHPESYTYGAISVKSSVAIPLGLEWTIMAEPPNQNRYGTSTGEKILGISDQTLIRDIWSTMSSFWEWWGSAKIITNDLTHELSIINFANLKPTGAAGLTITITYTLQ